MASAFSQIYQIWSRLSMSGRVMTVAALVGTVGLIGALAYYGSQPNYAVLFGDLKPADAQSIVEKLKTANIPYQLSNSGTTVLVPSDRISELRLQMASEGALSGGHVGYDLFDKTSFGATDFAQQVNYRRAIEGELAKTIEGMDEVESARVHVTPKKESVFSEKEEPAKASVMVRVRQNKELANERTEAIVNLISSSIEGLDPSGVSVMDTSGRLLVAAGHNRAGGSGDAGMFQAQLEAKRKFEAENAARVTALLEPVVGDNRVRADVAADIDFSQVEQNEEKFDPKSQVVRSQETSQESHNSPASAGGVSGARANSPVTQPTPAAATSTSGDQKTTSAVNYEVDKTTKKTLGGGGHINRMTVSVVVDNKTVNGVEVPRSSDELKQMQDLVAAAVGIDPNRGDSVVVQTMAFNKPADDQPANPTFLEKYKSFIPTATKYGTLIIIALLVLFFIVRPAKKALRAAIAAPDENTHLLGSGQIPEDRRLPHSAESEFAPVMTVSEMQAELNGRSNDADRIETIRKQIAAQSMTDTDVVVGTMRGWLRENA